MTVGEHQGGTEVTSESQDKIAFSGRPAPTEYLGGFGNSRGEASLEVTDQVDGMAREDRLLHLVIVNSAKSDNRHFSGIRGYRAGLTAGTGTPCGGAALHRLCVTQEGLGRLLVEHGSLGEVLGLSTAPANEILDLLPLGPTVVQSLSLTKEGKDDSSSTRGAGVGVCGAGAFALGFGAGAGGAEVPATGRAADGAGCTTGGTAKCTL
jgi:hypothetical protein